MDTIGKISDHIKTHPTLTLVVIIILLLILIFFILPAHLPKSAFKKQRRQHNDNIDDLISSIHSKQIKVK